MIDERKAARWARAAGGTGGRWRRRRAAKAWERLREAAGHGDRVVLALLAEVARDADHTLRDGARTLLAEVWAASRDTELREVVLETGALAPHGRARLLTAALHGRLAEHLPPGQAIAAGDLLADTDPAVRAAAEHTCLTAAGPLLDALWGRFLAGIAAPAGHGPGVPGLLLRNPAPPPAQALQVLWSSWLRSPDERLWAALTAWRVPPPREPERGYALVALEPGPAELAAPALRRPLLAAAARRNHPVGAAARRAILAARDAELTEAVCAAAIDEPALVPFCAEHRLAPRDPVRRVTFFLLTGQLHHYRGLDPDGRMLELAYSTADSATRTRLQTAMRSGGAADLLRVLVSRNRRDRISELSGDEAAWLARHLAERGEWAELWRVVQDLPLSMGLGLMDLFGAWVPAGEDDRRVFERMRATDPAAVRAGVDELSLHRPGFPRQARIMFHGRVNSVSFAPDAPLLAVAGTNRVAGVVDLAQGRLVERYERFHASVGYVVHTGGGAFVAAERSNNGDTACRLLRCSDGAATELHREPGPVTSLALAGADGRFAGGTRAGRVLLGAPDGTVRTVPVAELGLDPRQDWPRAVTAHLGSGRLAVLGRGLTVTGAAGAVLARGDAGMVVGRAVFTGPDTLVVASKRGTVQVLRRDGDALLPGPVSAGDVCGLEALPDRREVVLVDRAGRIAVLDAGTLEPVLSSDTAVRGATSAHLSPGGEYLAIGYAKGFTDLYDLRVWAVPGLAARPLVNCVPADLHVVAGMRAAGAFPPAARSLLGLLHDVLAHRFRFDIELGTVDAATLSAGEYDISL
ncbi:hypothetical protein GCM10027168_09710 [Streptomyces capparidis]